MAKLTGFWGRKRKQSVFPQQQPGKKDDDALSRFEELVANKVQEDLGENFIERGSFRRLHNWMGDQFVRSVFNFAFYNPDFQEAVKGMAESRDYFPIWEALLEALPAINPSFQGKILNEGVRDTVLATLLAMHSDVAVDVLDTMQKFKAMQEEIEDEQRANVLTLDLLRRMDEIEARLGI